MEKTGVLVHHLCDEHAPKCSILTCQTHALWVKHALKHYHLSVFLPSTYVLLPPPPLPSFDKVSHNLDWPWTCYVGEDDFELFLLPLECWECRHAPLCSVVCGAGDWTPRLHAWYSTNWVILNLHPSFLLWKTIVTMRWGGWVMLMVVAHALTCVWRPEDSAQEVYIASPFTCWVILQTASSFFVELWS